MSQTTDTNTKPSKELEIFRKWGGRATTNIAFKEWVMCTINVNKNKSVDELILMIKQGEVEFTHSQNHLDINCCNTVSEYIFHNDFPLNQLIIQKEIYQDIRSKHHWTMQHLDTKLLSTGKSKFE